MATPAWSACVSPGEVTEAVLAQVPDAAPVTHGGAAAGRLLAPFHATPPVPEAPADRGIAHPRARLRPGEKVFLRLDTEHTLAVQP